MVAAHQTPPVRPAVLIDAPGIFDLIKSYPDELVPRPLSDIIQNIDRFVVCTEADHLLGCAAWSILPEIGEPNRTTVEIKSVAVAPALRKSGIGSHLVQAVLDRIQAFGPRQAIVLTFAPEFFRRLGFHEVPKSQLMHKIYMGCINCTKHANPFTCPEIAMARELP